jgi:hypothetical protein
MILISNPRLILWPGTKTTLVHVKEDGRFEHVTPVSSALLSLLKAWSNPTSVNDIEQSIASSGVDLNVPALIALGLLVRIEEVMRLHEWEGFRLSDSDASLSPGALEELEVDERAGIDFPAAVVDNSLSESCQTTLANWFSRQSFVLADVDSERASFSKHWIRPLDSEIYRLLAVPVLGWVDALCRLCAPHLRLQLTEVKAYATPYGDVPTYHQDSELAPTLTAVLYCHQDWRPDWGGELIIADSGGEPRVAIAPRPGRLVVFRGDLPHKAGSPSRLSYAPRNALVLRYTVLQ